MITSEQPIHGDKVYKQEIAFSDYFSNIWWSTKKEFPKLNNKTSYWYKLKKERETNKFIDDFVKLIKKYSQDENKYELWQKEVKQLFHDFMNSSNLISKQDANILMNLALIQCTESFVNEARKFSSSMKLEDIGQAMRNVWIMNIIQMLLNKKIEFTPSIFAYSMLYPYTDNYLDDINISKEEKINISNRFEKRLIGEKIKFNNEYEKNLFDLVSRIESEYNRSKYKEVFESLLCIHRAQKKSLIQQDKKTGPYELDILGISFEKGGISVLADAYLVNGFLTQEQAEFFFGYGILLQICDDLQDALVDYKNGHMTIISQISKKWPLDNITNGLINFTFDLIDSAECFNCNNIKELKELIRKNCLLLILFAIGKNKNLYSKTYFKEIEQYFPYRTRYMNNFYKKLKKKYSNIKESYSGVPTEKIILDALKQMV